MPAFFFFNERKKGYGWGGEEDLEGNGGGKTIIRIYCVKTSIFNKSEQKIHQNKQQ